MTPITPSMVKSLTWNIIRECKRRHRTDAPLEPGAYVGMLRSLATVGNWGRGRFFIESVAAPQSVVSRLAAKKRMLQTSPAASPGQSQSGSPTPAPEGATGLVVYFVVTPPGRPPAQIPTATEVDSIANAPQGRTDTGPQAGAFTDALQNQLD